MTAPRAVEGSTCRICYEPENLKVLCKCNGTIKFVHKECIEQWIRVSHRKTCELCGSSWVGEIADVPQQMTVHSYTWSVIRLFALTYAVMCTIIIAYHLLAKYFS